VALGPATVVRLVGALGHLEILAGGGAAERATSGPAEYTGSRPRTDHDQARLDGHGSNGQKVRQKEPRGERCGKSRCYSPPRFPPRRPLPTG
jgi:hypothetical protein